MEISANFLYSCLCCLSNGAKSNNGNWYDRDILQLTKPCELKLQWVIDIYFFWFYPFIKIT